MANTYKDRKGYRAVKVGRLHRGCNIHGKKNCGWCAQKLTIQNVRIQVKAYTDEEIGQRVVGQYIRLD